jgi:hypothetical protein
VVRVLIIEREESPKGEETLCASQLRTRCLQSSSPSGAARPEHGDGDAGGCRQAGISSVEKNAPEMKAIGG